MKRQLVRISWNTSCYADESERVMELQTSTRIAGDILIVSCKGRIVVGDETALLRANVRNAMTEYRWIILNLSEVDYIDSTGIGMLVGLFATSRNLGGNMWLAGLMKRVRDLLQITKLLTVFETFQTVDEALAKISQKEQMQRG
jgi:anti-anti-sigma factor